MTYEQLLQKLNELTPDQLQQDVAVVLTDVEEAYQIDGATTFDKVDLDSDMMDADNFVLYIN